MSITEHRVCEAAQTGKQKCRAQRKKKISVQKKIKAISFFNIKLKNFNLVLTF